MNADEERESVWRAIRIVDQRLSDHIKEQQLRETHMQTSISDLARSVKENTDITRDAADVIKQVRDTQMIRRYAWQKFKQGGIVAGVITAIVTLAYQATHWGKLP